MTMAMNINENQLKKQYINLYNTTIYTTPPNKSRLKFQ